VQHTLLYMKNSLKAYNELRYKSKVIVTDLKQKISHEYVDGDDEVMDILRLICLEGGFPTDVANGVIILAAGQNYRVLFH